MKITFGGLSALALLALGANHARAHCDTLDGPVVSAARKALAETNVNLVLIWVQKADENGITTAFGKTLAVRKLNAEARDLADMYFFETLVRVHRAGEGVAYTGLKPSGTNLGAAIPAADKAIESGRLEPVARLLTGAVHEGLHRKFEEVQSLKSYRGNDVEAGRNYVKAYVEFVHYVEGVHGAASSHGGEHAHDEVPKPGTHEHH